MSTSLDLQFAMEFLRAGQNAAIILFTAIVYDYLIIFPREIIFGRWTWISTLFFLVRYFGLCWTLAYAYYNSVFFPGSVATETWVSQGTAINLVISWAWELFITSIDLVMVLRVYAMWSCSKRILGILLCIYVPQVITSFVFTGLFDSVSPYFSASTFQIFGISLCNLSYNLPSPLWSYMIPHYTLSVTLLVLAVVQGLKQSFEMYKVTKKWQSNRYVKLLVQEGIVYFLLHLLYNLVDLVGRILPNQSFDIKMLYFKTVVSILLFAALPRFIIGVREMYECDSRRLQGMDSAFGIPSKLVSDENALTSVISLTNAAPGQNRILRGDVSDLEEIQLDVIGAMPVRYDRELGLAVGTRFED